VVTRELSALERPLTEPQMALMTASYRNNGTQTVHRQLAHENIKGKLNICVCAYFAIFDFLTTFKTKFLAHQSDFLVGIF
jgi:hypothetical protein